MTCGPTYLVKPWPPNTARFGAITGDGILEVSRAQVQRLRLQLFGKMAKKASQPAVRKPRTDAQRNRERILEVAKEAFTQSGANASLDEIAKQAGVGPGTLYRHFSTREELIEAVYRTEVEKLAAAERTFAETMPPLDALRAWMLLFVDYITPKNHRRGPELPRWRPVEGFRSILRSGLGSHSCPGQACRQKRRHSQGPRSYRSAAGAHRRRQRWDQP